MSLICPFAGLRPVAGRAADVIAPPYDVLNSAEARQRAAGRPWSFLHISRAEIDLPEGTEPYDAAVYSKAAENLQHMLDEGVLQRVRRVYHGLVADWLLEQSGERLEEYAGLIANHLELAGRKEEAVGYLLQAGDRARSLYARQEAIQAYDRALALLDEAGVGASAGSSCASGALQGSHVVAALDSRAARDATEWFVELQTVHGVVPDALAETASPPARACSTSRVIGGSKSS